MHTKSTAFFSYKKLARGICEDCVRNALKPAFVLFKSPEMLTCIAPKYRHNVLTRCAGALRPGALCLHTALTTTQRVPALCPCSEVSVCIVHSHRADTPR
eukprot:1144851-Pelagomonas_calceolata.AAC.3